MLARISVASAVVALAAPTMAEAATRYAAPAATGAEPCLESSPCDLDRAVEDASPGDEIVVASGDYEVSGSGPPAPQANCPAGSAGIAGLRVRASTTVHGIPGQPRPRISAASNTCTTVEGFQNATLRHLEIRNPNGLGLANAVTWLGGELDGLVVDGPPSLTVFAGDTKFTNSLVTGTQTGSVQGEGLELRNLTLSGNVLGRSGSPSTATNVIAMAGFTLFEPGAAITVDHSYGSRGAGVTDGGSNISSAPQFVDAPGGDYHQLETSPTRNAGADAAANGAADLDGGPREAQDITDIGADEFGSAVATVLTGPASDVGSSSARVSATVNPNGVGTGAYFEYGTTTAYGLQTAAADVGSGFADQPVAATLAGLTPGTTYHYRVVGTNGLSRGPDRSFTTTGFGSAGPLPGGGGTMSPSNVFTIGRPKVFRNGTAVLPVTVPGPGRIVCVVAARTTARSGAAKVIRVTRVVRAAAGAGTVRLAIKPSRTARRLLARRRRLRATARVSFTPTGGTARTKTRALVLRLRRR